MIPKPPFLKDLTPESEAAEFEALKPRLAEVWDAMTMADEVPHTSVIVPSLTLDQSELKKISGASFYEERLLFLLIRLRNPRARMVYVTSQPIHPIILEYYLQFLAGIPASHARSRLTLLCADDASPRSLTEKILERPRLIERIRAGIVDPSRAYLTVFNSTPHERKLAVLLGIPLNGCDPRLSGLGTKSGAEKGLREAGVDVPWGFEDLRDAARRRGGARRAPRAEAGAPAGGPQAERQLLRRGQRRRVRSPCPGPGEPCATPCTRLEFSVPTETHGGLLRQVLAAWAASSEEFIEAAEKHSPSAQFRIGPRGDVLAVSTHDQILGGPSEQVFLGCRFPARDDYRVADPGGGPTSRAGARRARASSAATASTSSSTATRPPRSGR